MESLRRFSLVAGPLIQSFCTMRGAVRFSVLLDRTCHLVRLEFSPLALCCDIFFEFPCLCPCYLSCVSFEKANRRVIR